MVLELTFDEHGGSSEADLGMMFWIKNGETTMRKIPRKRRIEEERDERVIN